MLIHGELLIWIFFVGAGGSGTDYGAFAFFLHAEEGNRVNMGSTGYRRSALIQERLVRAGSAVRQSTEDQT